MWTMRQNHESTDQTHKAHPTRNLFKVLLVWAKQALLQTYLGQPYDFI